MLKKLVDFNNKNYLYPYNDYNKSYTHGFELIILYFNVIVILRIYEQFNRKKSNKIKLLGIHFILLISMEYLVWLYYLTF